MGTKVILDPRLGERFQIQSAKTGIVPAEKPYLESKMIVIDDIKWKADFSIMQTAIVNKHRKFKDPFSDRPFTEEVVAELDLLAKHVNRIFKEVFPKFKPIRYAHQSLRPLITGPEPLHFDTFPKDTKVGAFVNIAKTPRVYNVGPSFKDLVTQQPEVMKEVIKECNGNLEDLSYMIRVRTVEGKSPMGSDCPRHRVELAPGSIWFMNPKTVSHEVVYGECVSGHNWLMEDGSMPTQIDLVAPLLR